MAVYAYIRVSTKEQNIERQLEALRGFDVPQCNIFCDHQSGKDLDRLSYKKMIGKIKKGDLIIIKSIDRLGRNYSDILSQWQHITKTVGADILVLDMELLDTRSKTGDLTGRLIADLVLQILAYVAETERNMIHQRQLEGIAIAKAKGIKFGRTPIKMPDGFCDICEKCRYKMMSIREGANILGVSHTTFYRNYQQYLRKFAPNSRLKETR